MFDDFKPYFKEIILAFMVSIAFNEVSLMRHHPVEIFGNMIVESVLILLTEEVAKRVTIQILVWNLERTLHHMNV